MFHKHLLLPTNLDTKYRSTNNFCRIYSYPGTILFKKVHIFNFLSGSDTRVQLELSLLHFNTRNVSSLIKCSLDPRVEFSFLGVVDA